MEPQIAEGISEIPDLNPADAHELTQRMLRLSLGFFAAEVIRGDVSSQPISQDPDELPAPARGHTVIADFHLEWEQIVRKEKQFCIIAPRDHGKSHIFTIALPIWEGWRRPGIEIVIFSETQPQAERQLEKLKREVENNPRLAHLMDPTCWSAKKIRFTNGSQILAVGFQTKARGMHPHLVICDDVVSEAAMYSELIRERQHNYFFAAVRNMLVPGGTIAVIGTPQHQDDLYSRLEANGEWFFKRYQAIDQDGEILFPERYDRERLEARRREIGQIRFQREFLGLPTGGGMTLFPDELVSGEPFFAHHAILGPTFADGSPTLPWWIARGVTRFYAGVDIATSTNVAADWFVIFVVGLDARGNRWVVDIFRDQALGYKAQKAKIVEKARLWRVDLVAIEANAAQSIYGEEIREDTDVPVYVYHTGSEKHSLERGIPSLRLLFENGKYRAPRGDEESILATTQWIGELQSWTFTKDKGVVSVARHDDVGMAHWLCEQAIAKGEAFSFAFGEQPGDREAAEEIEAEVAALSHDDPWVSLGLEPEDLVGPGRRGNLDFAGETGHQGGVGLSERHQSPAHPFASAAPTQDSMLHALMRQIGRGQ